MQSPTIRLHARPGLRLGWQSGIAGPACLSRSFGDLVAMRTILTIALVVLLALCAYLGSYFALVQRGRAEFDLGFNFHEPVYRLWPPGASTLAEAFYKPAQMLDHRLLRPAMWVEKVDIAALLAANLAREEAVRLPNPQANERQPVHSETNRTSAAASDR
jgi:hypothetical protein